MNISWAAPAFLAVVLSLVLLDASAATLATHRGLEISLQFGAYRYSEASMSLSGNKSGGAVAYIAQLRNQLVFKGDIRFASGELFYESASSGTKGFNSDQLVEGRMVWSRDFFPAGKFSVSPFAGVGIRNLYSDLRGTTSTGAAGYRRYSEYFYIPTGVTARLAVNDGWIIAPTLEYDHFIVGTQISKLSDTGITGFRDTTNTQRKGLGYRIGVLAEKGRFAFGPWLQSWYIEDSDLTYMGNGKLGMEPDNATLEAGLECAFEF